VDQIARHPKWGGDPGDRNDVALLHLTADSAIAPVRLGTSTALVKGVKRCFNQMTMAVVRQRIWTPGSCLASPGTGLGWGRTPSSGGSTLLTLRESGARVLDFPLGTFWRVKSGACPGDSGGPLLVRGDNGALRQIGIASHATHGGGWFDWLVGDRCSSRSFDFYSDVSGGALKTWVESVTRVRDHRN